ncbi:MAG TPA: helix-turn-helix transcriptional regulator [Sphingobium sp.]|uniref:helix-turn-helix transcriptional regulator n=1 Tax=Sphingobium sp. TaxID=1912891 RepID=UPI002ED3483F
MADFAAALLDGAFEKPLWSTFLLDLRRETESEFAILLIRPEDWPMDEGIQLISGDCTPDDIAAPYRKHFHPAPPMPKYWGQEGAPYSLTELLAYDSGAHAAFYDELINDQGVTDIREMRVQEPGGIGAWLTIVRRDGEYGRRETRLMADLAPLLRGVLRLFMERERERFSASVTARAVGNLQIGWLVLDRGGIILDADSFADTVLARSDILHRASNGRLAIAEPEVEREIFRMIGQAAEPGARSRAIVLRNDPRLEMLIVPPGEKSLSIPGTPAAIAYLHGDNWRSADRSEHLADMFSLSRSEARLALALCRGSSIGEAGELLGLKTETVRSYSKTIYAKTGARGLSDLMRIVRGGVLSMAAEA